MQSFKEYINPGAFQNTGPLDGSTWGSGQEINQLHLHTPTAELPTKIIQGKIKSIFYTKNPITIVLDNGTTWKLNKEQWDYLVKTGKKMREGTRVQIELFLDGTIKSVNVL